MSPMSTVMALCPVGVCNRFLLPAKYPVFFLLCPMTLQVSRSVVFGGVHINFFFSVSQPFLSFYRRHRHCLPPLYDRACWRFPTFPGLASLRPSFRPLPICVLFCRRFYVYKIQSSYNMPKPLESLTFYKTCFLPYS